MEVHEAEVAGTSCKLMRTKKKEKKKIKADLGMVYKYIFKREKTRDMPLHIFNPVLSLNCCTLTRPSHSMHTYTPVVKELIIASGTISETRNRATENMNTESLAFHHLYKDKICYRINI